MKSYDISPYCEKDGCFAKPQKILMYKGYPLQLCLSCFTYEVNLLRSNKAWSRRLKAGAVLPAVVNQSESEPLF